MRLTITSGVVILLSVVACARNLADLNEQSGTWIQPAPGKVLNVTGCEFSEFVDSKTFERSDYVACIDNPKRRRVSYQHRRVIGVTIDSTHRFVLINDYFTSKTSRVVIADLLHHNSRNISSAVERLYKREVNQDPRVIVNPQGKAFSPDGRFVLIEMGPTYFSVNSAAEARKLTKKGATRWYTVESDDGRILHEFVETHTPQKWW